MNLQKAWDFSRSNINGELGFEFNGQTICDFTIDPTGRFGLKDMNEAIKIYGLENILSYISQIPDMCVGKLIVTEVTEKFTDTEGVSSNTVKKYPFVGTQYAEQFMQEDFMNFVKKQNFSDIVDICIRENYKRVELADSTVKEWKIQIEE